MRIESNKLLRRSLEDPHGIKNHRYADEYN